MRDERVTIALYLLRMAEDAINQLCLDECEAEVAATHGLDHDEGVFASARDNHPLDGYRYQIDEMIESISEAYPSEE